MDRPVKQSRDRLKRTKEEHRILKFEEWQKQERDDRFKRSFCRNWIFTQVRKEKGLKQ